MTPDWRVVSSGSIAEIIPNLFQLSAPDSLLRAESPTALGRIRELLGKADLLHEHVGIAIRRAQRSLTAKCAEGLKETTVDHFFCR